MNLRILGAILKKDLRSLYPLALGAALLFAADVILVRLDLIPVWSMYRVPLLQLAGTVVIFAVIHTDPAVSLVDDWLCRPVPRAEMLTAKLILLLALLYLSRVIATLIIDPLLGASLAETLQEAFLLQDSLALLMLLPVLFIAMVTRTMLQGLGVLLAIVVCVFVIPTGFVSAPGPLEPAIGEALSSVGLDWLSITPAMLAMLCMMALGCWFVYWRRNTRAARALLGVSVVVALLLVLLPMWLVPWKTVYAAQTTFSRPGKAIDTSSIYLSHLRACFPATRVRDLAADAAFAAARRSGSVKTWTSEDQAEAGPDSIALLTAIEPRRLPLDWRARLAFVEAEYHEPAAASPMYSLRPVAYDVEDSSLTHAWVLPEHAVRRLSSEPRVELKLRYYLTLLEPHSFKLPVDGLSRRVPRLGYCSAKPDATGSRIDVECFSGLDAPAQISAELADIPASRVYGPPDFSPRWTRWAIGRRLDLTLESARLRTSDHINVTAWKVAGYLDKSLVLPGILGDDVSECPLPVSGGAHFQQALWRDSAPHETTSVIVDEGVQLEVLDFGGQGSPIVLLPGLGATAHSYDELAPLLARTHRVVAITRRGTGYSSKPDFGFDTPHLARDVLRVMDTLGLEKALLVGHSIAGDELTWLGGHHPERFSGLVYLDAAYDRSADSSRTRLRELRNSLPPEPPVPPRALRNHAALTELLIQRGYARLPEGELIAFRNVDKPFLAGTPHIDARTLQAITAGIGPPDYAAVKIPALAIYAFEDPGKPLPSWYDANDRELMSTLEEIGRIGDDMKRRSIELFRQGVEKGRVLELRNATHYLQQSNQLEVLDAIETFSHDIDQPAVSASIR